MVGTVFPMAVAVLARDSEESSGVPVAVVESMDHLGGALGAFLPGVILFPLFGVAWTCILLAVGLACVSIGFLMAVYLQVP